MPDLGPVVASLAVAALVVVMLGFALGTQRNVSRGNARLEWLQSALPTLGRRTTLRWLGSSVVELDFVEPSEPFRDVAILVVLEPRDVPLLWLFARAGGRRDVVIFRTSLRRAPRLDLEAASPAAWIRAGDAEEAAAWPKVAFPDGITATAEPDTDERTVGAARRAWERIAPASGDVWRLSIRRTVPHLEVHLRPPKDPGADPSRIVDAIRDLAMELSRS